MPAKIVLGGRKSKWGNRKTSRVAPGPDRAAIVFASEKEARRYDELVILWLAGKISYPCMQIPFALKVNGELVCTYVADFVYLDRTIPLDQNQQVVEDVKGKRTREYRIKAKLFHALFGFAIREV